MAALKLDALLATLSARLMFWATVAINILLLSGAVWLYWQPPLETQFSANVLTESFIVDVPAGGYLPQSLVATAVPVDAVRNACNTTAFELYAPGEGKLRFAFSMIDGEPSVLVQRLAQTKGDAAPYGVARCGADSHDMSGEVRAYPFRGRSAPANYVLEGEVQLGQIAGSDRAGILRSGVVVVSSSSLPSRSARLEERRELMLGDEVQFFGGVGQAGKVASNVVVRYDAESRAFHVVSHAAARSAEVKRPGFDRAVPITVAPTLWARLQAQSEWTIYAFVLAILLNIMTSVRAYAADNRVQKVEIE